MARSFPRPDASQSGSFLTSGGTPGKKRLLPCSQVTVQRRLQRPSSGAGPVHLLVDSTGLKLSGTGEWLVEKLGAKARRSWRKLHIGVDAETGQIVATQLTTNDVDDG
jgi:hypothetical protein